MIAMNKRAHFSNNYSFLFQFCLLKKLTALNRLVFIVRRFSFIISELLVSRDLDSLDRYLSKTLRRTFGEGGGGGESRRCPF